MQQAREAGSSSAADGRRAREAVERRAREAEVEQPMCCPVSSSIAAATAQVKPSCNLRRGKRAICRGGKPRALGLVRVFQLWSCQALGDRRPSMKGDKKNLVSAEAVHHIIGGEWGSCVSFWFSTCALSRAGEEVHNHIQLAVKKLRTRRLMKNCVQL